jgi:seryl-tRNA synthetase
MDFKSQINSLMDGKGLNTNSIKLYIRNLERLNDNKPLKNLNYLNKYDDIEKKLEKYKDNTKRNFYVSIVSALSLLKDKHKGLNKSYKYYYDKMNEITKEIKAIPSTQKSEQQEKNWIKWSEVEDKYKSLKDKIQPSKKVLSSEEFDDLLDTVLMGLYVLTPVRRNQDYMRQYSLNFDT